MPHILKLLFPKLERQLTLAKSVQVIDALQEIKIHEEDVSFLHPQWLYILGKSMCSTASEWIPCMDLDGSGEESTILSWH